MTISLEVMSASLKWTLFHEQLFDYKSFGTLVLGQIIGI